MSSSSDKTTPSIEGSQSLSIDSLLNRLIDGGEISSSDQTIVSDLTSSNRREIHLNQPMLNSVIPPPIDHDSLVRVNPSLPSGNDKYNEHESSIELCMAGFVYKIQQACAPLNPSDRDLIYTIVESEWPQLSKDSAYEIVTLQIARLKDHNVYDLEEIEASAIAKLFVSFYDQWHWWNKYYMNFHADA